MPRWTKGAVLMLDILGTDDRERWNAIVDQMPHDVYHRWEYHRFAEENGEGLPRLVVWGDTGQLAALPLLVKPIPMSDGLLVDANSVYGYPGPIAQGEVPSDTPGCLASAFEELGVISVFTRTNPLLGRPDVFDGLGNTVMLGPTISLDLGVDEQERVEAYSRSTRRRIRRLIDEGALVRLVEDPETIAETFDEMYLRAMRRLGADETYAFPLDEQERLRRLLADDFAAVVCELDEEILAIGLYLTCDGIVQAHLAADNLSFRHLAPQRLEIHGAARLFAEKGRRTLHLGGGVGASCDSLLDFKRGFGGRETAFSIWTHVADQQAFDELTRQAPPAPRGRNAFFPAYRAADHYPMELR